MGAQYFSTELGRHFPQRRLWTSRLANDTVELGLTSLRVTSLALQFVSIEAERAIHGVELVQQPQNSLRQTGRLR